jgi:hypothetical protein
MSSLGDGGQHAGRLAVIIGIICLAVVALVYVGAELSSHHAVHTPNPVAPLVGAVDRARATAGAANDRANHPNGQTGSTLPDDINPLGP